jgi:DNA mismatch repair ATPase MutS
VATPPRARRSAAQASPEAAAKSRAQLSFLSESHPVVEELKTLDINSMTPLEALSYLHRVKTRLGGGN